MVYFSTMQTRFTSFQVYNTPWSQTSLKNFGLVPYRTLHRQLIVFLTNLNLLLKSQEFWISETVRHVEFISAMIQDKIKNCSLPLFFFLPEHEILTNLLYSGTSIVKWFSSNQSVSKQKTHWFLNKICLRPK